MLELKTIKERRQTQSITTLPETRTVEAYARLEEYWRLRCLVAEARLRLKGKT